MPMVDNPAPSKNRRGDVNLRIQRGEATYEAPIRVFERLAQRIFVTRNECIEDIEDTYKLYLRSGVDLREYGIEPEDFPCR